MTALEKIIKLMDKKNIGATNLEKTLDFANGSIGKWKQGLSKPSADAITKIANYFNISTDYLLGLIEEPISISEQKEKTAPIVTERSEMQKLFDELTYLQQRELVGIAKGMLISDNKEINKIIN